MGLHLPNRSGTLRPTSERGVSRAGGAELRPPPISAPGVFPGVGDGFRPRPTSRPAAPDDRYAGGRPPAAGCPAPTPGSIPSGRRDHLGLTPGGVAPVAGDGLVPITHLFPGPSPLTPRRSAAP